MPAQGKTNASRVTAGDRILVRVTETGVSISATKTGDGVTVARVTGKDTSGQRVTSLGSRSARMTYNVHTSAGTLRNLAPIQTMWLAPEDAAGIKRAHAEALEEDHSGRWLVAQVADQPTPAEEPPTREEALAAIGGCWAGGTLTGKALAHFAREDYAMAYAVAQDQKALQASDPEGAVHPEERAFRDRPETRTAREELGSVAADLLDMCETTNDPEPDPEMVAAGQRYLAAELKVPTPGPSPERDLQLAAYSPVVSIPSRADLTPPPPVIPRFTEVGPGVWVAPMGTPEPTPEDLSDLAAALVEEDLEHPEPKDIQPRDVVTIHRGTRLYLVERVEEDSSRNRLTGEVLDQTMALVSPVDPEDERPAQWVHVDLLHVRQPVARVQTVEITGRVRQTQEALKVEGPGWDMEVSDLRVVRTILTDSARVPVATLVAPPLSLAAPVGVLRVGEAIVVDGRCFAVTEEGELEPAPHRDRLKG